mgnify:CR=1 FL=1
MEMRYKSQKLALWYFWTAIILFGAQVIFGLIASYQYLNPNFLFGILNFMTNRMLHINAMVVWLLMGFLGAVYWFLPLETEREVYGIRLGKFGYFAFIAVIAIVVLVYLFKQIGIGNLSTIWFITEGREYIEAPRWADIGIVAVALIVAYNVIATTFASKKFTGILGVLIFDMGALFGLYLCGMFFTPNISVDQYWWWWVVHLWVEATWEILVGVLMGFLLMHMLGTPRKIIEVWLYVEVSLVIATGVLGLGHHYYWIGTPRYWLGIGGFFSALEPIPLVAMVIHAIYEAGLHQLKTINRPALFWCLTQAFGNLFGAGVWGFMQTLPQINLFSHGTQLAAAHGHLAFFGAYVAANLAIFYFILGKQRVKEGVILNGLIWRIAFVGLLIGIIGMTGSLTVAGFAQTMLERATMGSTWEAYTFTQIHPWIRSSYTWRFFFGIIFTLSYFLLLYDLLTIGKRINSQKGT